MLAARLPAEDGLRIPDPDDIRETFAKAWQLILAREPQRLVVFATHWLALVARLHLYAAERNRGGAPEPVVEDDPTDRRFADDAWRQIPFFDVLRQGYRGFAAAMRALFADVADLDPATRRKLDFYLRLWLHAIAPSNFPHTNPVVLRHAAESQGASLRRGLAHFLDDLERGGGRLAIRTTRDELFELGRDLATTPGKVIFRNDLMELIQYRPATEQVYRRPLLIVPPWINKYYILDLRPRNSFVRFAVEQGFTVFLISWRNPDASMAHKSFEDYLADGPLAALDTIVRQTGERVTNVLGYCIGGTLTACLLAWLAARGERRVGCATFLTTMTDFAEPGDLGVFIDDKQLARLERYMQRHGYLDAAWMQTVFSLLRDNDLVWTFVVNNYLLGREPPPFDLLFWNADGTRMPAMMHSFYLRRFYLENRLVEPGGIRLLGEPIDLGRIRIPCYFLSTRDDHIAPWRSTYAGARRFGGPVRFVLGASGHIAGVVNPPGSGKYGYWTHGRRPVDPDAFLARARWQPGSWWPDWAQWLARRSGARIPARDPETGRLPPLGDAPGDYVRVRAT
ncbi:Poly(3-hydroxyalkanoate) polymerase subunit PhaC [bacterium HR40]|nr:Poly(3-hydroxyalkanoate) polymerase subunit PhaC [bacterium HR40]